METSLSYPPIHPGNNKIKSYNRSRSDLWRMHLIQALCWTPSRVSEGSQKAPFIDKRVEARRRGALRKVRAELLSSPRRRPAAIIPGDP